MYLTSIREYQQSTYFTKVPLERIYFETTIREPQQLKRMVDMLTKDKHLTNGPRNAFIRNYALISWSHRAIAELIVYRDKSKVVVESLLAKNILVYRTDLLSGKVHQTVEDLIDLKMRIGSNHLAIVTRSNVPARIRLYLTELIVRYNVYEGLPIGNSFRNVLQPKKK